MTAYSQYRRPALVLLAGMLFRIQFAGVCLAAGGAQPQARPPSVIAPTGFPGASQPTKPALVAGSCTASDCHAEFAALPVRHGPLRKNQCLPCHVPVDGKHEFKALPDSKPVCLDCHQAIPPGKDRHQSADTNCLECHDPHGGKERFFLRSGSGSGLCLTCHGAIAARNPRHPFREDTDCLNCHELHHAADKPLLRATREQICLSCHDDIRQGLKQPNNTIHQPVAKDCTLCHRIHGGAQGPALTASPAPALCRNCHLELLDRIVKAKHLHEPLALDQPCAGCHAPHFSRGLSLLKATTRDLCLGCHDRSYKLNDGSVIEDVKAQITQKRYVHGPARQGSCTPCHDPHGSDYPRLLKYDYPCSFYATFKESRYDLCFRCHNREMVLKPQTDVTRFRNGLQNLHYLHVNQEKGRTCQACHHQHASNSPLQIRDTVPFGNWTMPLIYKKSEHGGSCTSSCHGEHSYNRVAAVQN